MLGIHVNLRLILCSEKGNCVFVTVPTRCWAPWTSHELYPCRIGPLMKSSGFHSTWLCSCVFFLKPLWRFYPEVHYVHVLSTGVPVFPCKSKRNFNSIKSMLHISQVKGPNSQTLTHLTSPAIVPMSKGLQDQVPKCTADQEVYWKFLNGKKKFYLSDS